jgi:translocation and assembly module TamB
MLLAARREKVTLPNPTFLRLTKEGLLAEGVTFRAGGGEIVLGGRIGADSDLRLSAKSVPLALAEVFVPGAELAGTVSVNATLAGPLADPRGRYEIALENVGADVAGAERISGRIGGDVFGRRAGVTATLAGSATKLAVEGSVPLAPGALDIGLKGKLDLVTALTPFANGARIAGTATLDARLGGTLAVPRVTGTAEIAGGAFRNGAVDLGEVTASVAGRGDRIELGRFDGKLAGGGKVVAYGPLLLDADAGFPLALKLDLDGARIGRGELVTAVADAALDLQGSAIGRPTLRGLVALRGVELRIPDPPIGDASPAAMPPLLGGLPLEARIKIVAPNRVLLRGRGIEAELGGEVLVTVGGDGTSAEGSLEFRRGYVGLADLHVPLTGGWVRFTGPLDPRLSLVALSRDAQGAVSLVVEGPLSDPGVRLVSTPAATDVEMVTRLLASGTGGKLDRPTAVSRALDDLAARGAVFTAGAAAPR